MVRCLIDYELLMCYIGCVLCGISSTEGFSISIYIEKFDLIYTIWFLSVVFVCIHRFQTKLTRRMSKNNYLQLRPQKIHMFIIEIIIKKKKIPADKS